MKIEIKHRLARDEAKNRISGLIDQLKREYGSQIQNLNEKWVDYTDRIEGSAKGHSISGTIDVKDQAVNIDLKLPFILKIFSGRIRSVIEDHVRKELN
jgi:putative polyhydroxyalkanoate system protein